MKVNVCNVKATNTIVGVVVIIAHLVNLAPLFHTKKIFTTLICWLNGAQS